MGIRKESKEVRKYETDQIKLFTDYAKGQGGENAERYYMIFTKLINDKAGIAKGQRDEVSQEILMEVKALETLVKMRIHKLMERNVPYKQIYRDVKEMVEKI